MYHILQHIHHPCPSRPFITSLLKPEREYTLGDIKNNNWSVYKRFELHTREIKILRFLFRPDYFSPKFYRAQSRFFFREKKTGQYCMSFDLDQGVYPQWCPTV